MRILAGDIGGTHTRLVVIEGNHQGDLKTLAEKYYDSQKYDHLITIIQKFLNEFEITTDIDASCLAIAGPVSDGVTKVTNLPWLLRENELTEKLNISDLKLINDFSAVTYGINELSADDLLVLQTGSKTNKKFPNAAVIGAGTGLGVSHRVWLNDRYQAFSSETGHTGFAPENELECALLGWLQKQYSHVSLELILSGRGVLTIYNFLKEVYNLSESSSIRDKMNDMDPAQVITESALEGSDELCTKTLECFVEIYGSTAGNVALNYYPVDEIYIAGGIATKIYKKLAEPRFINALVNKGAMTENLKKLQIYLIKQEKVGLFGAIATAKNMLNNI